MNILFLIASIIFLLECCISFVVQQTLGYYIPAALNVLGAAACGFCVHFTYLSYRDRLLKTYTLETLKKICSFKYVFVIPAICIIAYYITYLVIHADAYPSETRLMSLQLGGTLISVILPIRVLSLIEKEIFANSLMTEDST